MKEEVLETLDFDHFTTKQLASEVRKSGLYQADKIIERMEQLFEMKEEKEEQARMENDQLKNDMNIVKRNLNTTVLKSAGCYHSYYGYCNCGANPWIKYVDNDVKSRYEHL